jgi:glucose/arabinose dehydrogenase
MAPAPRAIQQSSHAALAVAAGLVLVLAGCTATPPPEETVPPRTGTEVQESPAPGTDQTLGDLTIASVIADGLRSPWGLAFLPDGTALVSERDSGNIRRITDDSSDVVGTVPGVRHGGEGGLLGLAIDPDVSEETAETEVFAYITSARDNRVLRMIWDGQRLGAPTAILTGIPRSNIHNGGRMRFGPDGFLYVATGDAADEPSSQQRDSLAGKILRITRDGSPAPGNPTAGSPIFSTGHRNVQGLAFDVDGQLFASEFGQRTWDELNRIRPGGNYGWPQVEGRGGGGDFIDPIYQWEPADASPSGLAIIERTAFMASLRGERLWRIELDADGGVVGEPTALFVGELGRLRTVEVAPDGSLWLITSNTDGRGNPRGSDDRILRLTFG